jgi:nitrite reductase/ring-hydroxylating ferredoxin subunit
VADFQSPGIYDALRASGFFVVSSGNLLSVVSSMCTHRNCRLKLAEDRHSFVCKCHGSTFDANGHVTQGRCGTCRISNAWWMKTSICRCMWVRRRVELAQSLPDNKVG